MSGAGGIIAEQVTQVIGGQMTRRYKTRQEYHNAQALKHGKLITTTDIDPKSSGFGGPSKRDTFIPKTSDPYWSDAKTGGTPDYSSGKIKNKGANKL